MTFEEFAIARMPSLLRYARVLTGDREQAQDVVQEVLAKAQAKWKRIRKTEAPDAYVHRMVLNQYLSWRWSWSARNVRPVGEQLADLDEARGAVRDHAQSVVDADELRGRLSTLGQVLNDGGGGGNGLVQPAASADDTRAALDAFTKAGYTDLDARRFGAKADTLEDYKIMIGRKLLAGEQVRPPLPKAEPFVPPKEWKTFYEAGYNVNDAVELAKIWKLPDPGEAKVKAGKLLAAGEKLPITKRVPVQEYPMPDRLQPDEQAALAKYRAAGYDEADVQRLAEIWKMDLRATDPLYREAKILGVQIAAGRELVAGRELPIKP